MPGKESLICILESFNRKERFFLIAEALGKKNFELSQNFRQDLAEALELPFPIPDDASCWMDYHLDWVYASLLLHRDGDQDSYDAAQFPGKEKGATVNVGENQEDADLLIAFPHDGLTQLIFVEAKGATLFGNSQIASKGKRLGYIFGSQGKAFADRCHPYFVVSCPTKPSIRSEPEGKRGLYIGALPGWMTKNGTDLYWHELVLPPKEGRRRLSRTSSAAGSPWRIKRGYR